MISFKKKPEYSKQDLKEYTCAVCRRRYKGKDRKFAKSYSMIYTGNDNCMTVCKPCVYSIYEEYLDKYEGDERKAIKRICMMFDLYFSEEIVEKAGTGKLNYANKMAAYLKLLNLKEYLKKTYDDYLFGEEYKEEEKEERKGKKEEEKGVSEKYIKTWGFGFNVEEYKLLNNKYSEWKSKVIIDGVARESLVRDLCVIKLQQQKALQEGEVDLYNRLQKTYQDTLSSANLKPIQTENDDKIREKPLGVLIEMFENENPIPEPLEEWKDTDKIVKLFNTYFLGHLCKMLNIKNRYSEMYEKEMNKYRLNIDEIQNLTSDEDIFEYLMENGFKENEGNEDEDK